MIDKIIYINLEHRSDRKEEIETELNNFGLEYERFNAINHSSGIVGCGLSHLSVLKLAKEKKYKNILILEDDFTFLVSKEVFSAQIKLLADVNFDVCMLSYVLNNYQECEEYPFLLKVLDAQTTSGYVVNESMYDKLIELYSSAIPLLEQTGMHWIYANDQIWKSLQPDNRWYCFKTRLGKQRPSYSDCTESYADYDC